LGSSLLQVLLTSRPPSCEWLWFKMPVEDYTSESDACFLEPPQDRSRIKRAGGIAAAATLLLGGVAAFHAGGLSRANSNHIEQKYEETVITPPISQCSDLKADCSSTKCCKATGYKCFSKTPTTAKCMMECTPGKDGLCTELVTLKAMEPTKGLKFFCFTYYMQDTGSTKQSFELELLKSQYSMRASIFGCPKWAVYSDADADFGAKTIKVTDVDNDFHLFKRKKQGTWTNAMQFYQAWLDMKKKGSTAGSDWVVKVDVDSVFLPDRLLKKLAGYHVPTGGVYIDNCAKVKFGFFGNLEVVSQDAFATFLANLETCKATLDWKGEDPEWKWGPYGEDLFMQMCLDAKGVPKKDDFIWDADGACKNDMPKALRKVKGVKWLPNCLDINHVVFHPFKKPDEYNKCLAATQGYTMA